jgi:hypothetical protein
MSLVRTIALAAVAGLAALCLIVFLGRRDVQAEEEGGEDAAGEAEAGAEEPEAIPPRPQRTRTPFELYAADADALTYESLSNTPIPDIEVDPTEPVDPEVYAIVANETKKSVDDIEEWAETKNGYAVHQKWSQYSRIRREQAALKLAEYETGLTGTGETGVE